VVDKTGLTGKYDFELKWDRNPATMPPAGTSVVPAAPSEDASRASIFTALQEQLGLKLIPIKSQLESIVIDHIEKPSAN
jgi:bla regulator protein blaR1